jgi:hypothetical protein
MLLEMVIPVRTTKGSFLPAIVSAEVYTDRTGAGEQSREVSDIEIYWPGKDKYRKMPLSIIADFEEVITDFLDKL